MKRLFAFVATLLLYSCTLSAANMPSLDGYAWLQISPDFKLGWVTGYAQAMDSAAALQMGTCIGEIPLYHEKFSDVPQKDLIQKMCVSETQLDYDGIKMMQFVDGMDTFYKDYRNEQIGIGWAIEYVRTR